MKEPAFAVTLLLLGATAWAAEPKRPNVLLIVADDMGYTDLGVTGGEIRTPNLDALARSGLLLTSFLVSPACSPTRAMLLSGADTHPAGLGTMAGQADLNQKDRPGYEGVLSDRVVPFPTLLRAAGYHTYIAGKWHLGTDAAHGPQRKGFEHSFVLLTGGASHFADAAELNESATGHAVYQEDGRNIALRDGFYSTDDYTDKLIGMIKDGLADGRPFFAYAAYTSPHWPLQLPDAELDRYRGAYDAGYDALRSRRFENARRLGLVPANAAVPERTPFAAAWDTLPPQAQRRSARAMELYAAMVENLDRHVGRLLQFLKDSGHYDDTLILFFSDNGPEGNPIDRMRTNADWIPRRFDNAETNLGRANSYVWLGPGWAQATTPFRLWKGFPTEGGVRLPAIARFGSKGLQRTSGSVVTVKDVAPTVLELAGVRSPGTSFEGRTVAPIEGRSMLPLIEGRARTVHRADFTMGWELFGRRALRQGRFKIVWLYEPYGPGRWELFDLAADPLESRDLASGQPAKLAELVRAWDAYAAWAGVVLPTRDMGYAIEGKAAGREPDASHEWRVNSGTPDGRRFSPLRQIDRTNVGRLEVAWRYRTDDMRAAPASTIQCTPVVVDGVMYLTTPGLKVVALDAATSRKLWEFDPSPSEHVRGTNRGVTYWSDGKERRVFSGAGSYLYALDAASGKPIPGFGANGRIDLRDGLDRDVFSLPVTATSPAIVYQDLLIVGSMVGEGPGPAAPGHIRAYDARTGERRWIFHTIPHPGEPGYETWPPEAWKTTGGANAWGGFTLDARRGLVFLGTGSASYDHWGGDRIGANLYANSVVALRARTGAHVWHFQAVHHDLWDYDLPCPPVLVSVKRDGRLVDAVAQTMKVGHLFLLDRETGEPLFPVEERAVPRSELPGEASWPTQPFPRRPPPFARQRFTEAEVTELSPEARAAILARLRGMRTGDVFLPPGLTPSVALPQFNGGAEWGGSAFDEASGLLFVNASNEAEWISMVPARPPGEMTLHDIGQHLYQAVCTGCHGSSDVSRGAGTHVASLASLRGRLTRADVERTIAAGRGQMPAFATLKPIELRALAAFLLGEGQDEKHSGADLELSFAGGVPYVATGHNEFRDPQGFPANQGPWGTLTAIDLARGELRWQVPLGSYPALEARGLPPTGTFNIGGPLATAGGLVFIGAAMDERFHAFDAETGKLLWQFQMDAGGYASPASFEVDGRQYVVIAAGGGGKPETRPGDSYYCFALPRAH